jgi:hypothetical protein
MYSRASLANSGFGPCPVNVVEHFSVPFDEGDEAQRFFLAGRAWLPSSQKEAEELFPNVKGKYLYCEGEEEAASSGNKVSEKLISSRIYVQYSSTSLNVIDDSFFPISFLLYWSFYPIVRAITPPSAIICGIPGFARRAL